MEGNTLDKYRDVFRVVDLKGWDNLADLSQVLKQQPRIELERLLDENGLVLEGIENDKLSGKKGRTIEIDLLDFVNQYDLVREDSGESARLLSQIYSSKKRWFFIGYFIENGECCPFEVRPSGLNLNDYDIKVSESSGNVLSIKNKFLNLPVKFHDLTLSESSGLAGGYVANSAVEVWTEADGSDLAGETINILHLHVNDTSDEVTFDVAYMHTSVEGND